MATWPPKKKGGRPPGSKSGPKAVSCLYPGGSGSQRRGLDPNAWHLHASSESETSDEDWLPPPVDGETTDEDSSDDELLDPDEEELLDPDDAPPCQLHDLDYERTGARPSGYRLMRIDLLDQWLRQNACCPKCAEQRAKNILDEFVSFCGQDKNFDKDGKLHGKLVQFWQRTAPRARTATKSTMVPRMQIVHEAVSGWSSTFKIACQRPSVNHRRPWVHQLPVLRTSGSSTSEETGASTAEVNLRMVSAFANMGRGANDWLWFSAMLNMPLSLRNYKRNYRTAENTLGASAAGLRPGAQLCSQPNSSMCDVARVACDVALVACGACMQCGVWGVARGGGQWR
eukprot:SAG31_NODE_7028_length_1812_cov_2.719206_2_plen_342_part_00